EIEHWSADTAIIWVRIPSILANTDNQSFKLHIGNAAATTKEWGGEKVFRPADGWVAVWHMTGGTTAGSTTPDATGNGHDGTLESSGADQGQTIADTTMIGVGKVFRATNTGANNGGFAYLIDNTNTKPINN